MTANKLKPATSTRNYMNSISFERMKLLAEKRRLLHLKAKIKRGEALMGADGEVLYLPKKG